MKYLICGLGNPGEKYEGTRHNIGFDVVDYLAGEKGCTFELQRHGQVTECSHKGRKLTLMKPSTYMNLSGKAVRYWMQQLNIQPRNILVVTDDVNLPAGKIRLKGRGSAGGHNGLENIIALLQTSEFPRLRFGVGNDYPPGGQVNYVLGPWTEDEKTLIKPQIKLAAEAILSFASQGLARTMNQYN